MTPVIVTYSHKGKVIFAILRCFSKLFVSPLKTEKQDMGTIIADKPICEYNIMRYKDLETGLSAQW